MLWDTGSTSNLISENWAKKQGLTGTEYDLSIKVATGGQHSVKATLYNLNLVSRDGSKKAVGVFGMETLLGELEKVDFSRLAKAFPALKHRLKLKDLSIP